MLSSGSHLWFMGTGWEVRRRPKVFSTRSAVFRRSRVGQDRSPRLAGRHPEHPVHSGSGARPGDPALRHLVLAVFELLLVLLLAAAHVDDLDPRLGGPLGHGQVVDQAGGVLGVGGVVGGEPAGERGAGAHAEVAGHRLAVDVEHVQDPAEVLGVGGEQPLDQLHDPGPGEPVGAAGAAVLVGLPAEQRAQRRQVGGGVVVVDRPHVTLELAGLVRRRTVGLAGVQLDRLDVRLIAVPEIDDR